MRISGSCSSPGGTAAALSIAPPGKRVAEGEIGLEQRPAVAHANASSTRFW